ncbi:MAG: hypothetical protein ACT4QF_20585 [Sporichthyaceae bacterium]
MSKTIGKNASPTARAVAVAAAALVVGSAVFPASPGVALATGDSSATVVKSEIVHSDPALNPAHQSKLPTYTPESIQQMGWWTIPTAVYSYGKKVQNNYFTCFPHCGWSVWRTW